MPTSWCDQRIDELKYEIEEMSKNTYDLERQCWVKAPPTGTYNFISFNRLAETLRETGEIRPQEILTHFEIRDYGLHYRVDRK